MNRQLHSWAQEHKHVNAYQAFASMTSQHSPPSYEVPEVAPVSGIPNNDVDVFSDGALNYPTCPFFALSNSAVWWPARADEPTNVEMEYTSHKLVHDGLE
eukprot:6769866-Karenia_brevis.AAC.1